MANYKSPSISLIILLIISIIIALYYFLDYNGYLSLFTQPSSVSSKIKPQATPLSSPIPTRSPSPLIPDSGTAGTFKVNHQSPGGPTLTQVVIDPLDPNLGDIVTVKLTLTHPQSIDSVKATLETDDNPQRLSFDRESRTQNTETWASTFKLKSNIKYHYLFRFEASSDEQATLAPMALRNQPQ